MTEIKDPKFEQYYSAHQHSREYVSRWPKDAKKDLLRKWNSMTLKAQENELERIKKKNNLTAKAIVTAAIPKKKITQYKGGGDDDSTSDSEDSVFNNKPKKIVEKSKGKLLLPTNNGGRGRKSEQKLKKLQERKRIDDNSGSDSSENSVFNIKDTTGSKNRNSSQSRNLLTKFGEERINVPEEQTVKRRKLVITEETNLPNASFAKRNEESIVTSDASSQELM